nr:LysM peptidoglycan-binding domain-containing protein [Chloroflexota bacterium]
MRIVRVNEPARQTTSDIERGAGLPNELINNIADALPDEAHDETSRMHEVVGGSEADSPQGGSSERLDDIAYKHYGNSSLWRLLAAINNIDDPMHIEAGTLLRIPQVPGVTDGGAS